MTFLLIKLLKNAALHFFRSFLSVWFINFYNLYREEVSRKNLDRESGGMKKGCGMILISKGISHGEV